MSRTVTGARYGVRGWLVQRLTALLLAAYGVLFAVRLAGLAWPLNSAAWRALFEPAWMRHATFLFVLALCWHAWLGMRDIYMDYLRHTGLRLAAHGLTAGLLIFYLSWATAILWRLP